jgi:probable F420-dependent oxidoreductase
MQFGIDVDQTDYGVRITDLARAVEGAGLESLFMTQRTHVPASRRDIAEQIGHEMDTSQLDPFVSLGAAAAVTSRIKLGTGSCLAALYDPIILAKQVATLDVISQGRFLFGITPGWFEEEMRNHGLDPAFRWKVIREKVLAMKALWTEDGAQFHGRFVNIDPVVLGLKPVQKPHPPILVGSMGPHGVARTVEYGDEWMPAVSPSVDLESNMKCLDRACRDAGRPGMPVTAFLWELNEPLIEQCAQLGVARCIVYLYPLRMDVVQPFLERLMHIAERFAS